MIYKRYELSLSQNGPDLVHIARNAMGNVVFRESSEEKLKKAIDKSIEDQQKLEGEVQKAAAKREKEREQKKKRGLFEAPPAEGSETEDVVVEEETVDEPEESILVPATPPQARVTRGPDGKFISKSQLDAEEPKKKNLWEKLTS